MPRPPLCRRIADEPSAALFKPAGIPARTLDEVVLPLDGWEALRLADLEGLHHEEAAVHLGVSRATFGRVLENARRTVATALVGGLVLRIEGGPVRIGPPRGRRRRGGAGRGGRCHRRGRRAAHEKESR